jgi:hypothetical protein
MKRRKRSKRSNKRKRENECDLIMYKLVVFYVFIQIDICL